MALPAFWLGRAAPARGAPDRDQDQHLKCTMAPTDATAAAGVGRARKSMPKSGRRTVYGADEIKENFERLDSNQDGFLDFNELRHLLLRGSSGDTGLTDKQLRVIFRCVDKDNDNRVEFDEFVDWVYGNDVKTHKQKWEDTFLAFAGRDDRLSEDEFLLLMESSGLLDGDFGHAEAKGVFEHARKKQDTDLDPAGFTKAVARIAKLKKVKKASVLQRVVECEGPGRHSDYMD